ncbi:hypothetical protein GCM10019059_43490 [Camelimonas fluminis]|nr:hypothetical protein GCM10019059_43490 [Camelimonas fluminis]
MDERIRVSERFEAVFPESETFDLIFTVSVLVHNRPDTARRMISAMMDRLTPGGKIVLIENSHTAVSAMENLWYGGRWCHAFSQYFEGRADTEIIDRFADRHAIYIASLFFEIRPSRHVYHAHSKADAIICSLGDLLSHGLDQAEEINENILREAESIPANNESIIGQLLDIREKLAERELTCDQHMRRILELENALNSMSEQCKQLSNALSETSVRFADRQKLLEHVGAGLRDAQNRRSYRTITSEETTPPRVRTDLPIYEKNKSQDIKYAHTISEFEGLLHIFHAEWVGIRAAVGSLPGTKISISADRLLSTQDLSELSRQIHSGNYKKVLIHGFSQNMSKLVSLLSRMDLASVLYIIKHGNPAQWCYDAERKAAFDVLDFAATGRVRRVHFMKAGFDLDLGNIFRPMLFNMAPAFRGSGVPPLSPRERGVVFAPAWADWRKNLYTGLIAACTANSVGKILVYADNIDVPNLINNKIIRHKFIDREQTFGLITSSSVCMNASIVDCHPMVNIEAQSFGVPCVRGRLNLDALEDHPYVKLTEVDDAMSIANIRSVLDRVLAVPENELRDMTLDYQAASDAVSRNRYGEFLEF